MNLSSFLNPFCLAIVICTPRLAVVQHCAKSYTQDGVCWSPPGQWSVGNLSAEQVDGRSMSAPLMQIGQTQLALLHGQSDVNRPPVHLHPTAIQSDLPGGWGTDFHPSVFSGLDWMKAGVKTGHVRLHPPLHWGNWKVQLGTPERLTGRTDRSPSVKGALVLYKEL